MNCSHYGYTVQVPTNWRADQVCGSFNQHLVATSPDTASQIIATISKHGWWSATRSKASIAADLACPPSGNGVTITCDKVVFAVSTFNGHTFTAGIGTEDIGSNTMLRVDLETFAYGRLFKFYNTVTVNQAAAIEATDAGKNPYAMQLAVLSGIWSSIHITKPQA
jgi:hypothetical protein